MTFIDNISKLDYDKDGQRGETEPLSIRKASCSCGMLVFVGFHPSSTVLPLLCCGRLFQTENSVWKKLL